MGVLSGGQEERWTKMESHTFKSIYYKPFIISTAGPIVKVAVRLLEIPTLVEVDLEVSIRRVLHQHALGAGCVQRQLWSLWTYQVHKAGSILVLLPQFTRQRGVVIATSVCCCCRRRRWGGGGGGGGRRRRRLVGFYTAAVLGYAKHLRCFWKVVVSRNRVIKDISHLFIDIYIYMWYNHLFKTNKSYNKVYSV